MFYLLIVTYILGGISLVPLLILAAIAYAFYDSVAIPYSEQPKPVVATHDDDNDPRASPPLKAWLTVRHTFEPSPSSYISIVRTLLDARTTRTRRAEDAYYAVLKRDVLYLYEDEAMSECAAAIDVRRCDVRIVPDDDVLLDGELFAKRNAVLLREKDSSIPATPIDDPSNGILDKERDMDKEKDKDGSATHDARAWFIFFRSAHDMEDWYFALLAAPAPFPHAAQRALIDALDALPDRIPTRWLNALIGRLFLGVKGTRTLQDWVIGRLMKKLGKVKTPSWLTAVVVRSFDAGDVPPVLSKPMLKELTLEGAASVGVDVSYIAPQDGGIRITLSATASIALPAAPSLSMLGFKSKEKDGPDKSGDKDKDKGGDKDKDKEQPYEVSLVLAVIVRRVEGNMLIKVKPPPSNRVWYAFTTPPRMDIEVVPVVSDRQIRWGMVLSGIEGKLREIIADSVVLPNMDDIPFFDTTPLTPRGGIFPSAFPLPSVPSSPAPAPAPQAPAELPTELRKARSTEALVGESGDSAVKNGPPEPDWEMQRAESIALGVSGGRRASVRKRRTWFGGSGDSGGAEEDGEREREEGGGGHRRGHSEDAGVRVFVTQDEEEEGEDTPTTSVAPPRVRAASSSARPPSPPSPPSPPLSRSAPSTSSPSTPTSTSSFLATLKSRGAGMAEKQPALKEAMRKWGGTWAAALRKNEDRGRERERERERDRDSERADHGDVWGEEGRSASRGSYADLRRKVEQRERERARDGSPSGSGSDSGNGNGNGGGSGARPIDIPKARYGELERRTSSTSTMSRRTASGDSSGPRVSPPVTGSASQFLTPSAPKTTTELHTMLRTPSPTPLLARSSSTTTSPTPSITSSSPAVSSTSTSTSTVPPFDPTTPTPTPPRAPVPIRAQPKAATMTIPGIHARHRGDLMGFGSVPPVMSPQAGPATPAEDGGKIQSVYRLLRGGEGEEDKPMPPPLPPRGPAPSAPEPEPASTPETPTPPATISPASQALKNLAEQDAAKRQPSPSHSPHTSISGDQANGEAGWKPPLPPRPRPRTQGSGEGGGS